MADQKTAQSLLAYNEPLQPTSADIPALTGSEVLLKVHHCGLCHSDLHLQEGSFDLGDERSFSARVLHRLPHILGHEIEGEVIALGPDAQNIELGERRIVYAWIGCGTCPLCLDDKGYICNQPQQLGVNVDGGFASHVVVPDARYLLNYDGIEPAQAGSFMCAGLTSFGAVKRLQRRAPTGPIMIIGLGGVGFMALQFARLLFEGDIIVVDVSPEKRELALANGATYAIDPAESGIKSKYLSETGGAGGCIDFVGSKQTIDLALNTLSKSGSLVVAGLYGGSLHYPIPYFAFKCISIEGSYVASLDEAKEMLRLAVDHKIAPLPVDIRPLEQVNEAMADLKQGKVAGRVILTP